MSCHTMYSVDLSLISVEKLGRRKWHFTNDIDCRSKANISSGGEYWVLLRSGLL